MAERARLSDERKTVETAKIVSPAEVKLRAAEEQVRLKGSRISWLEAKARHHLELTNGNLWERLGVALGLKKPAVGKLEYVVNPKS